MDAKPQLLITKRLFIEASSYAARADPVSGGIAISMLQDSAELYIWTLIKALDLPSRDDDGFVSHINTLVKAKVSVPQRPKLLELNKARIGFKHYGNLPATEEAKKHQVYIEDFLRTAMLEHFKISFDELSLIDLLADGQIKERLKAAEKHVAAGLFREAMDELTKTKSSIFSKLDRYIPKVDSKLREFDRLTKTNKEVKGDPFAYLSRYLNVLREVSLVALLRLPLEDYNFISTTLSPPFGMWFSSGPRGPFTQDVCRRAINCIVNLCIRIEGL